MKSSNGIPPLGKGEPSILDGRNETLRSASGPNAVTEGDSPVIELSEAQALMIAHVKGYHEQEHSPERKVTAPVYNGICPTCGREGCFYCLVGKELKLYCSKCWVVPHETEPPITRQEMREFYKQGYLDHVSEHHKKDFHRVRPLEWDKSGFGLEP